MDQKEHRRFMHAQAKEAQKYKKEQDEKAGRDLGQEPLHKWCEEESEKFRKKWGEKNKEGEIAKKKEGF